MTIFVDVGEYEITPMKKPVETIYYMKTIFTSPIERKIQKTKDMIRWFEENE